VRETVAQLYGTGRYRELVVPEMISEDFSLFLEETGGAFVLVGAAVGDASHPLPTNHSPEARFDDSVVPDMSSLLADLAIRRLNASTNGTAC
jgi:metal-dependent amidase/aminoacylase/carboxypeptidase family protein